MRRLTHALGSLSVAHLALLASLLVAWVGVTVMLGSLSLLVWAGTLVMDLVLRPAYQRQHMVESVTDALSVAVTWAVAWGTAGLAIDLLAPSYWLWSGISWTLLAELLGFYLGFVWVFVLFLLRPVTVRSIP